MNKFRFKIIAIFTVCSVLAGCLSQSTGAKNEYIVKKVVDGDTVELENGKRVRYIGIDTPETMKKKGNAWLYDPEDFAVEAKELNRALTLNKRITLEFDKVKEDKYGRWLAYVYAGDKMVNLELIQNGYATVYTFPPNVKYLNILMDAQKEAQDKKYGLWEDIPEVLPNSVNERFGKYVRVKGIISDVYVSPRKIFLNFGKDRRRSLTAVIYSNNIQIFSEEGIDPSSLYKNRYVEVVGKVEDSNGPRMIIDNPSQIRILNEKGQ